MQTQTDFTPRDDLFNLADDVVPLLVTDASDQPLMVGVRGVRRAVSASDVTASGGALLATDSWWHLACDDCALMMQINYRLVEPDGTRWQVVLDPQMQTCATRWKCACRHV